MAAMAHDNVPAEPSAILSAMRTTLDLDDHLMESLMARSQGKSKTKAVETAIAEYLRRDAARGVRRLRGKVTFEEPDHHWRGMRSAEVERQRRRSAR